MTDIGSSIAAGAFALLAFVAAFAMVQKHKKTHAEWNLLVAGAFGVIGLVAALWGLGYYSLLLFLACLNGYAMYQHRTVQAKWARPVMGVCASILLVLALGKMGYEASGCKENSSIARIKAVEDAYRQALVEGISRNAGEPFAGKSAIIIMEDDSPAAKERAESLRRELSKVLTVLGTDPVKIVPLTEGGGPDEMDDMALMGYNPSDFTVERLEDILSQYGEVDVIFSFVGLPMDLSTSKYAPVDPNAKVKRGEKARKQEPLPAIVLLENTMFFDRAYLTGNVVHSMYVRNPARMYEPDEAVPTDMEQAFAKAYVIITPENAAANEDVLNSVNY